MDGGVISVCKSLMAENAVKEPSCSQECNRKGQEHKGIRENRWNSMGKECKHFSR